MDSLPLLVGAVVLKCRGSLCEQARHLSRHFNTTPCRGQSLSMPKIASRKIASHKMEQPITADLIASKHAF